MHWTGMIIGIISFLVIGLFHPIVIKCECYFTEKLWSAFLIGGLLCCIGSVFVSHTIGSAALAVLGFTMLWSIGDLKEQTERVKKGWFPANPNRKTKV